ncbi:MAG: TAXI family TRAP transporter solute-binding subunit [Deltaproteobacteria bacterium]|nr:TAXI family TRAP transporter solute-binding subunit [Deltaproteobacteria bacterium]
MKKFGLVLMAAFFAVGLVVMADATPSVAKTTYVTIGTGGVTGVYYPTGGAIGKIVNKKRKQYGLRVTVESTGGSVFNVNAIMAGDLEFGIVQSDRQYQAVHALAEWKDKGKQEKLRAIFTIHPETFFLVAAEGSGIKSYKDLKGKAVAVGNPGSGQRQNFIDILKEYGMSHDDLGRAEGLKAAESDKMLQDGRVDAFIYTVGNPAGLIKEATSGRIKVRFIPVDKPQLDSLTSKYPYFVKAKIPVSFYPMALNKEDVDTFAVKATFVTSADVPDNVVYAITKEVFDNLESFKKLHKAYTYLTKEEMLQGMSAPVHPGAMKYYKEAGLDKYLKK